MKDFTQDSSKLEPLLNVNFEDITRDNTMCMDFEKNKYDFLALSSARNMQTTDRLSAENIDAQGSSCKNVFRKLVNTGSRFLNDENVDPTYSIKSFFKFAPVFWIYSLPIALNFVGPSLLTVIYFIMVAWYGNVSLSAGIGIAQTMY